MGGSSLLGQPGFMNYPRIPTVVPQYGRSLDIIRVGGWRIGKRGIANIKGLGFQGTMRGL